MAFRSPGARPSPRIPKKEVPEGPIQDFTTVIECTITEDWQKRTLALRNLVNMIPESYENSNADEWYNSAPTLRHLAIPVSDLLKDARSTVVKRTCEYMTDLFFKCKLDARYLLKDLMPTVCQVHGSTVQVIRNYVQIMILETLPNVPCKMAMPVWLDRLKHDKSRTVREACALYLSSSMAEWGASDDDDFENENNGYLSKDIYYQVGSTLVKSLRDPSPIVRQHCKKGMEVLASQTRQILDELVNDRSLTRDSRVLKFLRRLQAGETGLGDEMSVSSRMSTSSRMSRASISSAPATRSSSSRGAHSRTTLNSRTRVPPRKKRPPQIPTTIGVASPAKGLGPPRRMVNGKSPISPVKSKKLPASRLPMSPHMVTKSSSAAKSSSASKPSGAASTSPRSSISTSPRDMTISTPTRNLINSMDKDSASPTTPLEYEIEKESPNVKDEALVTNQSFESHDSDASVLRPIANAEELRKKAKKMTKRRSSLLQDRLLRSPAPIKNTNDLAMEVSHLSIGEIPNNPHLPMHTKIAYELLEAHKAHVDQIMETLKVEMDALKDFELIMLEQGPVRPTEEEVLEYFESLGLCLEQRKKAGSIMQKKMDRISQG